MKLLIKLSGESLIGEKQNGELPYDTVVLDHIVESILSLKEAGHTIALVVGGGNLFRGQELTERLRIERPTADYVGMLATVQNALVLRDYFQARGIATRVSSAIAMSQLCESYMPQRALRHLEKGRVVIFAAGLGTPFFTTDSTSVQRALEMGMELLVMAKNGVDGIYSGDPAKDSTVKFLKNISASSVLKQNLRIADTSAIALAKEHGLSMKVVGIPDLARALDPNIGSTITPN